MENGQADFKRYASHDWSGHPISRPHSYPKVLDVLFGVTVEDASFTQVHFPSMPMLREAVADGKHLEPNPDEFYSHIKIFAG